MRVMISGGGTGGGVYPALTVVAALKVQRPGVEALWVGSTSGPERPLVEREGLPFEAVPGGPLAGVGARALLSAGQISAGFVRALGVVRRFRPDVLLITGGWVTIPAALACRMSGVPVVIYLPDIEPGGTIKVLGRFAARVAVTSGDSAKYFRQEQVIETGYPVRPALLEAAGYDPLGQPRAGWEESGVRAQARERFGLFADVPTLLVFGGSRGARSINRALVPLLPDLVLARGDYPGCQIVHISGTLDRDRVREQAAALPPEVAAHYQAVDYLHTEDMALALVAADLVVARAGAGTLGEFPLFGLPAILVPYPHAWRYQKVNADVMVSRGAAVRLNDERLGDDLAPTVRRLLADTAEREQMAAAMNRLRRPNAAAHIAAALADVAQEKSGAPSDNRG
jgi:undecaprenyldiphospho-muramoylpentapeptide beta-N-acetylglucosaminyltransferase